MKKTFSLAHVVPMVIAWGILIPLSILCVKKRDKWKKWFVYHVVFVTMALVLSCVSTVYGVNAIDKKPHVHHFSSHHHIIGTIACGLILLQFALGVFIHFTYNPARVKIPIRDLVHWWFGRITLITALAAIFSGYVYVTMDLWVWFMTGAILVIFYVQIEIKN